MTNILSPVEPPYEAEAAALLESYPRVQGHLLSLFRTFANSTRFLRKGVPNLLDRESPLPLREREIVILRTTAHWRCEYEWGVHVTVFAEAAGFTPAQVAATVQADPQAACWTGRESTLLSVTDGLAATGGLPDSVLQSFRDGWTVAQQLEVIALCGTYHTVSQVANVARLSPEGFAARFPDAA
ncbi:MAG: hypothetical protein DHS20C03_25450 [Minwuia thermotolerans]|nr:MAG: hypothetical protein DHS20C03_25450 [Minwuia thermotolerans]